MRTKAISLMLENGGQIKMLLLMLLLAMCSGCLTTKLNNTDRLIAHPQFKAAAIAAPQWTEDALKTIADLEREIEGE
tara:strand:- start:278 stop:508 length:231 start_codon:yes stop_codon:yes gene_type:complete